LHERLEQCVANQDFERAGKLRDQIKRLNRISLEQSHLDVVSKAGDLLIVLPGKAANERQIWHLVKGIRWSSIEVSDDRDPEELERSLSQSRRRSRANSSTIAMTHHTVDETSIISRWIRKYGDSDAIIVWDDSLSASQIARVVLDVRPLDPDQLHEQEEE
jgi:excinuclease UvrABC nuclease subunit